MKFYSDMKIRTKLVSGFAIVLLLALAVGVFGLYSISQINEISTEIDTLRIPAQTDLITAVDHFQQSRTLLKDMVIVMGDKVPQYKKKLDEVSAISAASMEEFEARILPGDVALRGRYDTYIKARNDYRALRDRLATLASSDETTAQAVELMYTDASAATVDAVMQSLIDLEDELHVSVDESSAKMRASQASAQVMVIVVLVLTIAIGMSLGLAISNDVAKSIMRILRSVESVADGDFTISIDVNNASEFGMLADAVNLMIEKLRDVLMRVNNTAAIVDDASKQVSSSSMSLAQISTEQASSVEEISASMTEITSQTKANAENANKATQLSDATRDKAVKGNEMMGEMLGAMQAINETSSNISNIIKVIDDIAFQTNILALNAAVEAARAGQHGKGFAVVAEEVRNLAARSAKAASETTQMIEGAIKEVSRGTEIANETASSLNEIVEGVTHSATLVSEISEASEQQSQGASQISIGMEQVSQAIQTTSSVAEEAASSSSELSDQANTLKQLVSAFQFEAGAQAGRKRAGRPAQGGSGSGGGGGGQSGGGERRQAAVGSRGAGGSGGGDRVARAAKPPLGLDSAPTQARRRPPVPDIDIGTPNDFGKY
ncbi:MAG: methyl-accepting chemotaxis protein [Clostridiales bacterium]|jgi:methyl-accepting chemotaxis protein|nr:methyl-accepting chemotaxis protein [Clostridiales bacterium]